MEGVLGPCLPATVLLRMTGVLTGVVVTGRADTGGGEEGVSHGFTAQ